MPNDTIKTNMNHHLTGMAGRIQEKNKPDREFLKQHGVKAGLRHDDGSGVVVGVTGKGDVVGHNGTKPIEGTLHYCGYDINDIVNANGGYEEVVFLLLTGELPTSDELGDFRRHFRQRRTISEEFARKIASSLTTSHMMNSLQLAVQSLYEEKFKEGKNPDSNKVEDVLDHSIDIIAKFPSLVAYTFHAMQQRYNGGEMPEIAHLAEDSSLDHATHILSLIRGDKEFTKEEASILDTFLILHADHGGGPNSTFTVRVVSSSETDTYSAINAGLASLKGHLHGGANEKVMAMLRQMRKDLGDFPSEDGIKKYIEEMINSSGKVYGIGHAVFTLSDPRAIILRNIAERLSKIHNRDAEFHLLSSIADIAPKIIQEKKGKIVAPNVDFYSGFVLDCLGIPEKLYTPMFAASRVAGWSAHRIEQLMQNKLIRPAYLNMHTTKRYVPIERR